MNGVNIFNADTFEKDTFGVQTGIKHKGGTIWVKSRMMGFCSFTHNLKCAIEVFKGKADIIYFYKQ